MADDKNKKTWFLTGGCGFIGSHIAEELVRRGQNVIIFDNLSSGKLSNIEKIKDGIALIKGDITKYKNLCSSMSGADIVLHLAAISSVPESVKKPKKTIEVNIQGTVNVLEAARCNKVKMTVFSSSSSVYGTRPEMPYHETSLPDCHSPYALSKLHGEQILELYHKVYGINTVSLRYFNVFGPRQNPNSAYAAVIAKFISCFMNKQPINIHWDGMQTRDFIYIKDVVSANILAAEKGKSGEIYNVAQGKSCTLLHLADVIESIIGYKPERIFSPKRDGDLKDSSADIEKIKAIGFTPKYTLIQGLKELLCTK